MRIDRRQLLVGCGCAAAGLVLASRPVGRALAAPSPDLAKLRDLVRRGIDRDVTSGDVGAVFDLEPDVADSVLLPATKLDALPDGFAPGDLVTALAARLPSAGGQFVRSVIVDDTRALVSAAADQGIRLYIGSGYRSHAYQVAVFAAQTARWGDEDVANRYSARPGHSQHQLGTTIDFTTDFRTFRSSGAADWLRAHAHEFGFVLPYTVAATDRTGYVDEPWHGRWVGSTLASALQELGYQEWTAFDADDVIAMVRTEADFA